jgi:hypothetical protein
LILGGVLKPIGDLIKCNSLIPRVDRLILDLLSVEQWSQSVNIWFLINLLDLANIVRAIGASVNFESCLGDFIRVGIDDGINFVVKVLRRAVQVITLLNGVKDR